MGSKVRDCACCSYMDTFPGIHAAILNSEGRIGNTYEHIIMLLYYGADPFIKYGCCYPFELAILEDASSQIQELLFDYTFDRLQIYRINFKVLLFLALHKSPLFERMLEYENIDFFLEDVSSTHAYRTSSARDAGSATEVELLLALEMKYLNTVFEKQYALVCDSFRLCGLQDESFDISDPQFLEKLNRFMVSGDALRATIVDAIYLKYGFFHEVVPLGQSVAEKILIYLAGYGLKIPDVALNLVYKHYGYCDLFKFLLHVDYSETHRKIEDILVVALIRNIYTDLDTACLQEPDFYSNVKLLDVLDFCAHQKLTRFLLKRIDENRLRIPKGDLDRLKAHPQIPCLVELARNSFRKHLIERFQVKTSCRFYSIVKHLPIAPMHKKIISFEQKLY